MGDVVDWGRKGLDECFEIVWDDKDDLRWNGAILERRVSGQKMGKDGRRFGEVLYRWVAVPAIPHVEPIEPAS